MTAYALYTNMAIDAFCYIRCTIFIPISYDSISKELKFKLRGGPVLLSQELGKD